MHTEDTYEEAGGWIVHPVYDGDVQLMNLLGLMMQDVEASGHSDVGIQNILYSEVLNTRPRRVLEIGTHIGTAAVIIGSALKRNGCGKLLTLEPQRHYYDIAQKYVGAAGLDAQVEILPFFSYEQQCQLRLADEAPFDVIFIDGAHEYEAALHDMELCYGLLAANGLMILHDVGCRSPVIDQTGSGGARRALYDFTRRTASARTIFREYPKWLNECGAGLVCKESLIPEP